MTVLWQMVLHVCCVIWLYFDSLCVLQEALGHFVANNQKMQLTCPYIQKYAAENPEPKFKDLIINYIQKDDF